MEITNGLIVAYILDGKGGGEKIDWEGVNGWTPEDGLLWIHLDYTDTRVHQWIQEQSGLDAIVGEALLAEETRPRSIPMSNGLLAILRGINMNPGANPEDMVSIRIWLDKNRIITTRKRRLLSIDDIRAAVENHTGPKSMGEFVVDLTSYLISRMADVIDAIDETVSNLEEQVIFAESHELRSKLAAIRREAILLRRYLAPQREAISRLINERVAWLDETDRMRLREVADRTTRYIEDLDSSRERAAVTQEELMGRLSEQLDRRMYILSLVAAVFLPLGFLTGLLGVNVGGIPGANYQWGFALVCVILIAIGITQTYFLKKKRWM